MTLLSEKADYGDFYPLVKATGWLMSTAGAMILAWRGGSKKWLPVEKDIPGGHPARVASLLSAISLAILWYEANRAVQSDWLLRIAIASASATLAFYLINSFGVTTLIYEYEYAEDDRALSRRQVIGGLWLTEQARKSKQANGETTETIFKGMAYRPERVWPRASRALAQQCFVFSFIIFTLSGSVALACGGLIVLAARQPRIVEFTVSPLEIKAGDRAMMRWKVTNSSKTELEPGGLLAEEGAQGITPIQDSVYKLTASNVFGTRAVQLAVNVLAVAPKKNSRSSKAGQVAERELGSVVEARSCDLIKNVVIRGEGWLQTENDLDQDSTAECGIHTPSAGKYELFIKYAADESRPVRISLNRYIVQEKALAATTGGWSDPNSMDQTLGVVQLPAGNSVIQIHSEHGFPHIQQIRLRSIK
jgi:hypothetical protein